MDTQREEQHKGFSPKIKSRYNDGRRSLKCSPNKSELLMFTCFLTFDLVKNKFNCLYYTEIDYDALYDVWSISAPLTSTVRFTFLI